MPETRDSTRWMYAREKDLRLEIRWVNCGMGLAIFMDWNGEKGERRTETREGGMTDVIALVTSRAKRERAGMDPPQESGACCLSYVCIMRLKRIRVFFWVCSYRCVYSKHPA